MPIIDQTTRVFVLRSKDIKQRAIDAIQSLKWIDTALWKVTVSIYKDPKTREQEQKYHAMIGDIAKAFPKWAGFDCDAEDWKRLLIAAFDKARGKVGRVAPSLDFDGVVSLGSQSRKFGVKESAEFIEYLYAYGTQAGVIWSNDDAA